MNNLKLHTVKARFFERFFERCFTSITVALILLTASISQAQQYPRRTLFMVNPYAVNPAAAGVNRDIPLYTTYRSQWNGMNNHPKTFYLTANKQLPNGFGVGGVLFQDKTGAYSTTSFEFSGASHIAINRKQSIAFGLSGIGTQYVFDLSNAVVQDPNDVALGGGVRQSSFAFNANAGMMLYGQNYFFGVSVPYVLQPKINFGSGNINERIIRHYQIMGSYEFKLTKDWGLSTSMFSRFTAVTPIQVDLNAMVNYNRDLCFGLTYRPKAAWAAMLGWKFEGYSIWYSYEMNTGVSQALGFSSHEFTLGYTIKAPRGFRQKTLTQKRGLLTL
ncbi:MAG: type IX secretion system membrane protein PorP/SprF [Flavobacteriales bacterium]|jgi:type IX secretion system PorP/SprF family membrane protein|nr:type IX secretion system membrane protein PorP/SprF [Flavobacteriales bacterium]MDP4717957.1 type IX secretion system membrane protein PorP/SprF [Flavobacteriales bacterium]MDP4732081.1 type IX secretion system membrane protein PorP/SprF [Flavobacteriales bacterium]MDP4817406.1 type IX secretion system membrane protein PorP/SprF [Flavobacteriales bacterium]MDP4950571.1 type IX secretion system membrane protein PorP/SprF [Flavobacteriales bacterium]